MRHHESPVLVLMGPTASGKSALAIHLAQQLGGVILNADAMQCYDGLPILTAQPTVADKAQAPHALYGIWPPLSHGHAALWQQAAVAEIARVEQAGKIPILVGGTGMYVKLLSEGMAPVPEIPAEIRGKVRGMGVTESYALLQQVDAVMAERLKAGDTQRVARALEVVLATGKSLSTWQQENAPPLLASERFIYGYIEVPREVVYARINQRFEQMLEAGVLDEVHAMMDRLKHVPAGDYPLLKSHGYPDLAAYLQGEIGREEAIARAQQKTRNYAKRQMTWLRNQLPDAMAIAYESLHTEQGQEAIMLQMRKRIDR